MSAGWWQRGTRAKPCFTLNAPCIRKRVDQRLGERERERERSITVRFWASGQRLEREREEHYGQILGFRAEAHWSF